MCWIGKWECISALSMHYLVNAFEYTVQVNIAKGCMKKIKVILFYSNTIHWTQNLTWHVWFKCISMQNVCKTHKTSLLVLTFLLMSSWHQFHISSWMSCVFSVLTNKQIVPSEEHYKVSGISILSVERLNSVCTSVFAAVCAEC